MPVCGGLMWFNGKTQLAIERQSYGINTDIFTRVWISGIKQGQNFKFKKAKV